MNRLREPNNFENNMNRVVRGPHGQLFLRGPRGRNNNRNFNAEPEADANDVMPHNAPRNAALEATFLAAVLAGNAAEIGRILGEGRIDPGTSLEGEHPALWHAIHAAQQESIRALVDGGADLDQTTVNSNGVSGPLLNEAIGMNNIPLVRLLLELGANPNVGGSERSQLPLLAAFGLEGAARRPMVEALIAGGANPNKIIRVEDVLMRAERPHARNIPIVESSLLNHFLHLNDRDAIAILLANGANAALEVGGVMPINLATAYADEEYMRNFPPRNRTERAVWRRKHALEAFKRNQNAGLGVGAGAGAGRRSRRRRGTRRGTRRDRRTRRA